MNLHPSITADRIVEVVERHRSSLDDPGFCIACGAEAEGVEPDARNCGADGVFGAEELLLMLPV